MWPPLGSHYARKQHISQVKMCKFVSTYYSIGLTIDSIYFISSGLKSYNLFM